MAGLFGRIFKQWIEDALVKRLSENESFQRAAVGAVSAAQRAQELVESAAKDPSKAASTFAAVMNAVKAEAAKDLGGARGSSGETVVDVKGTTISSASAQRKPSAPRDEFSSLSSKELKAELARRGVPSAGLFEKSELLDAVRRAPPPSSAAKEEMS